MVLRRQKHLGTNIDRPVRRISYLRATANDTSVQEIAAAEAAAVSSVTSEQCDENSDKSDPIEEDLKAFWKYLKR